MTSNNTTTEIEYRGATIDASNTTPSRASFLARRATLVGLTASDLARELDREDGADAAVARRAGARGGRPW